MINLRQLSRRFAGHFIECSHWEPALAERPAHELPVIVYLHGNSSCRVEAVHMLSFLFTAGLTVSQCRINGRSCIVHRVLLFILLRGGLCIAPQVLAFDCAGSGLSGGDFVSLGYYERDDLKVG